MFGDLSNENKVTRLCCAMDELVFHSQDVETKSWNVRNVLLISNGYPISFQFSPGDVEDMAPFTLSLLGSHGISPRGSDNGGVTQRWPLNSGEHDFQYMAYMASDCYPHEFLQCPEFSAKPMSKKWFEILYVCLQICLVFCGESWVVQLSF